MERKKRRRWRRDFLFVFLFIIFSGGAWGERRPIPVRTVNPIRGKIKSSLSLTGEIVPLEKVILIPEVGGKLVEVKKEIGERVREGGVLARIEETEAFLKQTQAEIAFLSAQINYEKIKSLSRKEAEVKLRQAEANLKEAKARLEQAGLNLSFKESTVYSEFFLGLKSAQAGLEGAKANLEEAKRNLGRIERLYQKGAVTQEALDRAKLQYTLAESNLTSAEANLELLKKGAREEEIEFLKSQVEIAKAEVEKLESLKKANSSQVEIENAKFQVKRLESLVETAQANLELAQRLWEGRVWEKDLNLAQAKVREAEVALGLAREYRKKFTLTSPISGVVSKKFLSKGNLVSPSTPLYEVVNIEKVKVLVGIAEKDSGRVKVNQKAKIGVDAYPGEEFEGKVSPVLDPTTRKMEVEIVVPNPKFKLKPGMFARAEIILEEKKEALLLPRECILEEGEKSYVFVVKKGRALKRGVVMGIKEKDRVEIKAGVKEGEKVVLEGKELLEEGIPVRVVNQK